ncbi:MAG: LlaJI family restriction endonuclease [Mailhella sp.]|nr:LlaJI family restriction endonuclease [Mailhella sp.]
MRLSNRFVREEKPYTKVELFNMFDLSSTKGEKLLSLLLSYGVLIPVRQGGYEPLFKFCFVGIIFFDKLIIRCYPKYIRSTESPHEQFAQVMNVIRRYGRESKAEFRPGGEHEHMEFSLLAEALSLLDDYAEHGLYSNILPESELKGGGEILWDKTIGSIDPFFSNDTPFYMEFHTRRVIHDEQSYVTRLHKHLLTECSQLLESADLLELFGISPLYLNDEPREHFGSDAYIIQRLRAELDIQFDSQKQELLHRLIRFIERRESLAAEPLHLYGTTAFEAVWEAVCAKGFGDQLKTPLKHLPLPSGLNPAYRSKGRLLLIELIERPKWCLADTRPFEGNGTLIPDIATFYKHNGETFFLIFDSKYYTYSPSADRLPGIGDIDKQYLYELAFKPFLEAHGITRVKNIFLMPTERAYLEHKGYVELPMLRNLGLENIQIVLVPAQLLYECYLDGHGGNSLTFQQGILELLHD